MRLPLFLMLALCALPAFAQDTDKEAPSVASSDDPDAAETVTSKVPLDEIRRYVAVFNAVKEAYVVPVDDKKLMHSAIRGLLLDLDPHSTYFDKEDAAAFDEQATGAYDGVGVELLQQPDNSLRVIAPIDDTPAAKAGIKAGDVIVAIDGKPINAQEGMEPLRGAPGSKLTLTLGFSHPVEFEETDTIKIELKDALHFSIVGIDKQEVGQYAAEVRGKRPPEPYKGKGIRYVGEYVIRKEGKAGKGK